MIFQSPVPSSKGIHVMLAYTHPRSFVSSYQDDLICSYYPNFVSIPLLVIRWNGAVGMSQVHYIDKYIFWTRGVSEVGEAEVKSGSQTECLARFFKGLRDLCNQFSRTAGRRNPSFVGIGESNAVSFTKIVEWHIVKFTFQSIPADFRCHSKESNWGRTFSISRPWFIA